MAKNTTINLSKLPKREYRNGKSVYITGGNGDKIQANPFPIGIYSEPERELYTARPAIRTEKAPFFLVTRH